jgi:hypothetical protein
VNDPGPGWVNLIFGAVLLVVLVVLIWAYRRDRE